MGRFIIAKLKSLALQRIKLPPHLITPTYLILDEANTFLKGNSLSTILQESRKYFLFLLLANQTLISGKEYEKLKRNLLGNT